MTTGIPMKRPSILKIKEWLSAIFLSKTARALPIPYIPRAINGCFRSYHLLSSVFRKKRDSKYKRYTAIMNTGPFSRPLIRTHAHDAKSPRMIGPHGESKNIQTIALVRMKYVTNSASLFPSFIYLPPMHLRFFLLVERSQHGAILRLAWRTTTKKREERKNRGHRC